MQLRYPYGTGCQTQNAANGGEKRFTDEVGLEKVF